MLWGCMERRWIFVGALVVVVILFFGLWDFGEDDSDGFDEGDDVVIVEDVDFDVYNYDFVDEEVKGILSGMVRGKRSAFYLPPIEYINVSRGTKYGVAYALNNPEPSGENFFVFNWSVDDSVVSDCGVSREEAQGWIERGWASWGKIGEGWIDHMTVYLSFPVDAPLCSVKYNFVIEKDGVLYDTKQIEFRIVDEKG